jgi:hypothetical protein
MSFYLTDKNLQYTKEKHSDTYSADFFTDNTFFLSTRGTSPIPRALITAGSPVEGGVCPGRATATVTIKLWPTWAAIAPARLHRYHLMGPLQRWARPVPLQSHPRSPFQLYHWYHLGFGELPKKSRRRGRFNQKTSKQKQEKYLECNDKHSPGRSDVITSW